VHHGCLSDGPPQPAHMHKDPTLQYALGTQVTREF
jgi:hypothetical protein